MEKAEATLSTMLVLMANLAESPIMQSSPSSGHLLTIPLNEEDQETNAAWKTAESFLDSVKVSNPLSLSCTKESLSVGMGSPRPVHLPALLSRSAT